MQTNHLSNNSNIGISLPLTSWGRIENHPHIVISLPDKKTTKNLIATNQPGIAFGMGRSYGDVCLNPGKVLWNTSRLNQIIDFDKNNGRLFCEAGVLLRDIQRFAIPLGWMLSVSPGTQFVSVGGAIANDVHGKNHHKMGTFGDHLLSITLIRTSGEIIECGPQLRTNWFASTVGGFGLTGVIVEAEIQLRRINGSWFNTETVPFENLKEFFYLADSSEQEWESTVSWIDCDSARGKRGIFLRGNSSESSKRPSQQSWKITVPKNLPFSLVNHLSAAVFNSAYFNAKKWKAGRSTVHYEQFLYPLDNLVNWNRMYGPLGFFQYQCVIPKKDGQDGIQAILDEIARARCGAFLSVLKTFGNRISEGMMSFPQHGVTLAVDFPNRGEQTLKLFDKLDSIVQEASGRIYIAKDARMPRKLFEKGYPRLNEFLNYRDLGISSALSRRLIGS